MRPLNTGSFTMAEHTAPSTYIEPSSCALSPSAQMTEGGGAGATAPPHDKPPPPGGHRLMKPTRSIATVMGSAALVVALAACGSGSDATAPEASQEASVDESTEASDPTAHNDADTTFAQMMVVHHEGAIEMAQLAADTGSTEEVRALGDRIATAQGPEIELMTSWLDAWGEQGPDDAEMGSMDHGGMEMEGMAQDEVMAELTGLSGAEFDRRFLELMTAHHRGAIEMAEEHRGAGENPDALQLSGKIIDDQTAEITEMTNLLNTLQ